MWQKSRETILVICVLVAACYLFGEKASAQFFAGSYGAGVGPEIHRPGGAGWTPSPIALTDHNGRVTGSYNPANGRLQGKGFAPPEMSHYRHRGGQLALYVPMDNFGTGGVVIRPQNRQQRRYQNRHW